MSIESLTSIAKLAFYVLTSLMLLPMGWLTVLMLRDRLRKGRANDA